MVSFNFIYFGITTHQYILLTCGSNYTMMMMCCVFVHIYSITTTKLIIIQNNTNFLSTNYNQSLFFLACSRCFFSACSINFIST